LVTLFVISGLVACACATGSANALEIYVNHSSYDLIVAQGQHRLFNCKVGLGSPEFPTPIGTYYITHIYDSDPFWIPNPSRPWAYGMKPSKKVYGGTMAPLLRKTKPRILIDGEDFIELECELKDHDYRFHGTQQPFSIGRNQSHGCVRMLPENAKAVADIIKQQVGVCEKGETMNGTFVVLCEPVRLIILK
jgi:L,D-transpeptidase ErfK/SrfK